MKFTIIASVVIFTNIALAAPLKLACVPSDLELEPNGKSPMVMHIALGSATTDKLDVANLNLNESESGTTVAMEINFATHIGGPGRSEDMPIPVLKEGKNLLIGDDSARAVVEITSIKEALGGKIQNFRIEYVEKDNSMPFACLVVK